MLKRRQLVIKCKQTKQWRRGGIKKFKDFSKMRGREMVVKMEGLKKGSSARFFCTLDSNPDLDTQSH